MMSVGIVDVKQSELDEDDPVSLSIIRVQIGVGMATVYIIIRGDLNRLLICAKFLQ